MVSLNSEALQHNKRDVALERSLKADLDRSASGFAAWLAADRTSPSTRPRRNEELLRRLAEALADLPDPDARGRGTEALPRGGRYRRISERIGRTVSSVASLLCRRLEKLAETNEERAAVDFEHPCGVCHCTQALDRIRQCGGFWDEP